MYSVLRVVYYSREGLISYSILESSKAKFQVESQEECRIHISKIRKKKIKAIIRTNRTIRKKLGNTFK